MDRTRISDRHRLRPRRQRNEARAGVGLWYLDDIGAALGRHGACPVTGAGLAAPAAIIRAMAHPGVRPVRVPQGGLASGTFSSIDYADAYAVALPPSTCANAFARAVFASPPHWVSVLMWLRHALVAPLGLIATRPALERAAAKANGTAERIGVFPVLAEVPGEVLLGLDDRHLDFRVSVRVLDDAGVRLGVVTTLVRFHGALGRAYFLPVRPAHRLIVPAMLRHGARLLATSGL